MIFLFLLLLAVLLVVAGRARASPVESSTGVCWLIEPASPGGSPLAGHPNEVRVRVVDGHAPTRERCRAMVEISAEWRTVKSRKRRHSVRVELDSGQHIDRF